MAFAPMGAVAGGPIGIPQQPVDQPPINARLLLLHQLLGGGMMGHIGSGNQGNFGTPPGYGPNGQPLGQRPVDVRPPNFPPVHNPNAVPVTVPQGQIAPQPIGNQGNGGQMFLPEHPATAFNGGGGEQALAQHIAQVQNAHEIASQLAQHLARARSMPLQRLRPIRRESQSSMAAHHARHLMMQHQAGRLGGGGY